MSHNQGIRSKNLVHPSVRTGTGSRGTHPGGVAQLKALLMQEQIDVQRVQLG
jgi:hypothetical protein